MNATTYRAAFKTWRDAINPTTPLHRDAVVAVAFIDALDLPPSATADAFCTIAVNDYRATMNDKRVPEDRRAGLRSARISVVKSNLLARLLYLNEPLRTVPCPVHQGRWSGIPGDGEDCACGFTGWLP